MEDYFPPKKRLSKEEIDKAINELAWEYLTQVLDSKEDIELTYGKVDWTKEKVARNVLELMKEWLDDEFGEKQ